ncbi:MAG: phage tail sheath family protein [Blautia wexlerae]
MSKHGVFVQEEATALTAPITGSCSIPVVVGTAPVNMVQNPEEVINTPILANSAAEAMAALGYVDDFENYTLCQMMYATNNIYQVSPAVYINVLDPTKHKKALTETTATVSQMQAKISTKGIIPKGLVVKAASATLTAGTDYTTEFDTDGSLIVNLIEGGKGASATSITVSGNVLDPSMITKTDIIGAYNASTGKESGLEVVRQVYPKLGVVPGLIVAPGWSQIPEVGIAMSAKAANINGVFKAVALVDLDTTKATKYTDCKKIKEDSGFTSAFCYPTWPCVKVGDYVFAMSAVVAALIAYTDASNDDVPSLSPSNEMLGVTGTCLADGTEVTLDQDQGSTVNTYGVATAINMNGWKLWGNYTGAHCASSGDAKDIWLAVRRMFNWHGNNFIQTYFEKVDDPMNHVLIESIIDSENIRCAAYAPDKWAGAEMQYLASDNPITDTLAGKITFRQRIAPYTPAQEIDNILSYDTDMLKNALSGGGE